MVPCQLGPKCCTSNYKQGVILKYNPDNLLCIIHLSSIIATVFFVVGFLNKLSNNGSVQ